MVDLGRIQVSMLLLLRRMLEAGTLGAASLLWYHRADASVHCVNLHVYIGGSIEALTSHAGSVRLDSPCVLSCRKSCER